MTGMQPEAFIDEQAALICLNVILPRAIEYRPEMITFFAVMPVNVNVYMRPRKVSLQVPVSPPRNAVLATFVVYLPLRPSAAEVPAASAMPAEAAPTTATAATPSILTRPAGLMTSAAYRHASSLSEPSTMWTAGPGRPLDMDYPTRRGQ